MQDAGGINVSISTEDTASGRFSQPNSVGKTSYCAEMEKIDSKKVLWDNVSKLMVMRYGKENLTKLANSAKFGPGTATRIKDQETSVGTDILDKIADTFGLETWQLLVPHLDVENLPALEGVKWPFELILPSQYQQIDADVKRRLESELAGEWMRVQVKNGTNN